MPGRKLNFERVFDETWLDFLRSESGIWGLFIETRVRATYISNMYLLFQEPTSDDLEVLFGALAEDLVFGHGQCHPPVSIVTMHNAHSISMAI